MTVTRRAVLGILLIGTATASLGCGAQRTASRTTMPNPDGCYAQIFDEPRMGGAADFVNGPRRYPNLRDMPGRIDWKDRIRSVQLGPRASITAWSSENFRGTSVQLSTDTLQRGAFHTVPFDIQSLDIRCLAEADNRLAATRQQPQ